MADTQVQTGLTVEQWEDRFFTEYLTENRFSGDMGTDEMAVIQVKEQLTKKSGDRVTIALVNRLTNDAITGRNTLEGNEEDMTSRSHSITVDKRRNGVRVPEIDEQYSAISLREAARAVLKDWAMKDTEGLIIDALAAINGTAYDDADQTARDAWLVDNADRVLFGNSRANNAANDHSAGLDALDTTNDLPTAAALSLMKLIANTYAAPKIRPVRAGPNGKRYYVCYAHPLAFFHLKRDATITQAQREVQIEMENNRLFNGGDLLWDGLIVKEVPEMHSGLTEVNGNTVTVAPIFLCGAQAVGVAYAKRWRTREETFDYGDKMGVAIDAIYGVNKLQFGSGSTDRADLKDHGVVTGWFATNV